MVQSGFRVDRIMVGRVIRDYLAAQKKPSRKESLAARVSEAVAISKQPQHLRAQASVVVRSPEEGC